MTCLIIGNHTQGLGILRSLSTLGIETHVVNETHISLSRFSKYITKYHFIKGKSLKYLYHLENSEYLLRNILRIVPEGQRWVIFGMNEDTINFVYQNRDVLNERFLIPDNNIKLIIDKFYFAKEIEKIGLASPKTFLLDNFNEDLLNNNFYVCKGRIGNKFRNLSNRKGMEIKTKADLSRLKKGIKDFLNEDEVLLQQKIRKNKEVLSCCGFAIDGEILLSFQYVKLRQHPDEFGTGTFLKSIKNKEIFNQSVSIIAHFAYTGIYEIEYVKDFDEQYYVIEVNPRTWKSINFASNCGQNICKAYYDYMKKNIIPAPNYDYVIDKTWVDLGTDVPVLIKNGQFKNIGYNRNTCFCVLHTKDPLPFFTEMILFPLIMLNY